MAEREHDSKLNELLDIRIEALENYLKEKEKFKKLEDQYDKEAHEQRKKALEQLKKDGKANELEEKDYLDSLNKHLKDKEKLSEEELSFFKNAKQSILLTQKEYNKQLAEATTEEKKLSTKGWKAKYDEIEKKTEEWTKTAGAAISTVLDASSKFLDGEIAKYKERLGEVTKKIANVQKEITLLKEESAKVLAEAKTETKKNLATAVDSDSSIATKDKDAEKNKLYAELEELEFYHKQKAEIESINVEREKLGMEEKAALTTEQADRYNELINKHGDYAQSLDTKSQADKNAQTKEKDLLTEKEKLEKQIEKAESKKKKIEFAKQIITASINIAQGVTKAWALGPIIGPIMGSIVGAAGAVQLALMASKSKKFQDGGLLHGSRHAAGGMRIQGSNIEVEGGEYVVNRQSTDKNLGLIRYINSQRRQLNPVDINSFFDKTAQGFEPPFRQAFAQGGQLPQMQNAVNIDNELLLQAIQSIKFEPKVSVTDINAVQTDVVRVDAWTGM